MFCSNCGKQIPDTVKFCPDCGSPVKAPAVKREPAPNTVGGYVNVPAHRVNQKQKVLRVSFAEPFVYAVSSASRFRSSARKSSVMMHKSTANRHKKAGNTAGETYCTIRPASGGMAALPT